MFWENVCYYLFLAPSIFRFHTVFLRTFSNIDTCRAIYMGNKSGKERIIISVGGSLIVPNGGISTQFLMKLNGFIRNQLAHHPKRQFFLVIGGGATARHYIEAGKEVVGHELRAALHANGDAALPAHRSAEREPRE